MLTANQTELKKFAWFRIATHFSIQYLASYWGFTDTNSKPKVLIHVDA